MTKLYAKSGSPIDVRLQNVFTDYNIKPQVGSDSRGRYYDVAIPEYWLGRRIAAFDRAVDSAIGHPRNLPAQ